MQLKKTDVVAGMPAELARRIVREFRDQPRVGEVARRALKDQSYELATVIDRLVAEGYLAVDEVDEDGDRWLFATPRGNALAMARFATIRRETADRLVAQLIERAGAYNADPEKPLLVRRLIVFGSYLSDDAERLGDVDVYVEIERRHEFNPVAYAYATDRSFGSFSEVLGWARRELALHLRGRNAALSLTTQHPRELGAPFEVIFEAP